MKPKTRLQDKRSVILREFPEFRPSRPYFAGFGAGELFELVEEGCRDHRVILSAQILVICPGYGG